MMKKKEKIQVEIEISAEALSVHHATCSNGHSLVDESIKISGHPAIKVKVVSNQQSGFLYLDPIYGSHNNIEEGLVLKDGDIAHFFCPTCDVDLTDADETCRVCASPMFLFNLPHGGIVEGCLKKGCMFHKMTIVDAEKQIARSFTDSTLESYL